MENLSVAPVSVVIPTRNRPDTLLTTIGRIKDCDPAPAEIIIHIDAGDTATAAAVQARYPAVRILSSSIRMGPGGGRNQLLQAAKCEIVASFDDDSYPVDKDYFARLLLVFKQLPRAAVIGSQVTQRGTPLQPATAALAEAVGFIGCGASYRRTEFISSGGYVPLAIAYGMEELDLSLRLADSEKDVYFSPWLRVFHDTDLSHRDNPAVTAGSISNIALLAYLRYPSIFWPFALLQIFNKVAWHLRAGTYRGVALGLFRIPTHIYRHRRFKARVNAGRLSRFLKARRREPQWIPLAHAAEVTRATVYDNHANLLIPCAAHSRRE